MLNVSVNKFRDDISSNRIEAELNELLQAHTRRTDGADTDPRLHLELLQAFCARVAGSYSSWVPNDAALDGEYWAPDDARLAAARSTLAALAVLLRSRHNAAVLRRLGLEVLLADILAGLTRCVRALACADLDAARQLGLGERFRDLLLAAAGVGGEEASPASGSAQPSCVSEDGSMARPGRQAPGATPSVVPLTATLAEATVALWEWAVGGSIPDSTGPPPPLDLARLQFVLEAGVAAASGGPALDGADPVPSRRGPCLALLALAAHSVGAAWALPGASPAPSRHAPSAVTRVELLRACGVYDVAFLAAGDVGARGAEDAIVRASDGDASPAAGDPVVLVTAVGLLESAAGVPALPDAQAELEVELRLGGGEGGDATWKVSLAGSPGAAQQEAALHALQALFAAAQAAQRAALRRWALVPALFEAHARGTRAVRSASLDLLTGLLAVPAADEDDGLAKAALAAKLMEVLTHKVQGWRKHGTKPITDLMSCMRRALSTQAGELQPLFIQAQGCVQLVHALSQPMPLMQLEPVALAVLATLSALLKDSAPARHSFGEEVGWTILLAALERARGGLPPSWALLSAVLHLATETCFDPEAAGALEAGTEVANPGALGAYLALLRTARCDVAAHHGLPLLCAVLEASVGNRVSATVAGTTPALLQWLPRAHPHLLTGLLRALRASAGHSLPVADLRAALGLLRPGGGGELGAHHDGLLSLLGEDTLVWIEEARGRALAVALDSAAGAVWVHTWSPAHAALAFDMGRGLNSGAWHHLCLSLAPGGPLSHATATLWLDGRLQVQI
ncbi:hypothetical protein F751_3430 [Auxenochlorella protothecoides]|uniref:Neurobeachin alpha-solenoid region domain-containing protein n=1 Tax=Auxenochlorella protothecoides TaxID=3075 RepID=A0A087SBY5_AUXPR|nr:hypothetical protein F751_3430 [Auxenochlorella protothecoides]KFM23239.1 hypothetical protein F751_3430 [Auxenochlorella protothecoides]